jgi:hypothetical protein
MVKLIPGVGVGDGLGVELVMLHVEQMLTVFVSRVTAPVCASALPVNVDPVFRVILAVARMLPSTVLVVPSVAELPTTQ